MRISKKRRTSVDSMGLALALARKAVGATSPNPPVGAVIFQGNQIVGQGYTRAPGEGHAEAVALQQAGGKARGASLYVTLEPCCIQGWVAPCTKAIIKAGIASVHVAARDPNPLINGQGLQELKTAGIQVHLGERSEEATVLIEQFAKFITTGLPFVTAKFAISLDGKIATASGESRWITGKESRRLVHALRRGSDSVMVGVNTVLQDDPQLTARNPQERPFARQPLRVVVDSKCRTPMTARILDRPGRTLLAFAQKETCLTEAFEEKGTQLLFLPSSDQSVDLRTLLKELARRDVMNVLVEGGGTLLGSLMDLGLVDKVYAFIAPIIIGGRLAPSPVEGQGIETLVQALRLDRVTCQPLGEDILVTGYCPQQVMNIHSD